MLLMNAGCPIVTERMLMLLMLVANYAVRLSRGQAHVMIQATTDLLSFTIMISPIFFLVRCNPVTCTEALHTRNWVISHCMWPPMLSLKDRKCRLVG